MNDVSEGEQTGLGDAAAVSGYEQGCSAYHACPVQIVWVAGSLSMIMPEIVKWQEPALRGGEVATAIAASQRSWRGKGIAELHSWHLDQICWGTKHHSMTCMERPREICQWAPKIGCGCCVVYGCAYSKQLVTCVVRIVIEHG